MKQRAGSNPFQEFTVVYRVIYSLLKVSLQMSLNCLFVLTQE
jgi:hypothetical protein